MINLDFSVHALLGRPHRPPSYDWQTKTVWPIFDVKILWKQRHLHLGCSWDKL